MNGVFSRRAFLGYSSGLAFSFVLPLAGCARQPAAANASPFENAWVTVAAGGVITIRSPAAEMGQGSMTALPIIFAEEFDADWDKVRIEVSPADDALYANPMGWIHGIMLTVGSASVAGYFESLRLYGAQARQVMLQAAARRWGVDVGELITEPSLVVHQATDRRLSYGEIAAVTHFPGLPPEITREDLKDPSQFRLIGHDLSRRDVPSKVTGSAQFSIDVQLPDLVFATVIRPPFKGSRPVRIESDAAKKLSDVIDIIDLGERVAVVARSYAAALGGERALKVEWSGEGAAAGLNSDEAVREHRRIARDLAIRGQPIESTGDGDQALAGAARVYEAAYASELVYHAHLEPLNSVTWVKDDDQRVEIWAGTQAPTHLVRSVAEALAVPGDSIVLHRTFLGGGFGRRAAQDHDWVVDSALLSQRLRRPVKVIWSREADVRYGRFKPISGHYLRAGVDASGQVVAWHHRVASDEALEQSDPYRYEKTGQWPVISAVGIGLPYDIPNVKSEIVRTRTGLRLSPLRGVGGTANKFAAECFLDEIATDRGLDPLAFRLQFLRDSPAAAQVLRVVADMAAWHRRESHAGLGLAFAELDETLFATIAEIELNRDTGEIHVKEVWAAVDAGIAVQPANIAAQFESAINYALSNVLFERITVQDGVVQESNFHDYPVMRMSDSPRVHTRIIRGDRAPSGIGDTVGVTIAPAVANACASLTGRRLRELPFTRQRVLAALRS
jgi:isoquinoline 1-oxidoreductase beta subunit